MANPLMSAMLNHILLKQGKKTQQAPECRTAHLPETQERWLIDSVLRPKCAEQGDCTRINPEKRIKIVTLESLRGEIKEEEKVAPKTDREKIEKTLVTLASIGKLYKL